MSIVEEVVQEMIHEIWEECEAISRLGILCCTIIIIRNIIASRLAAEMIVGAATSVTKNASASADKLCNILMEMERRRSKRTQALCSCMVFTDVSRIKFGDIQ